MPRKLHLEALADGSFRQMPPDELRHYGYAARYASYTPDQIAAAGLTWEEYQRRNRELLALIEALPAPVPRRKRRPRGPDGRCVICGAPTPLVASLGAACAEHYDALSK